MADEEALDKAKEEAFDNFDAFLQTQPDTIKGLYASNVSGLKTALESERESRKKLSEQVKTLSPQVEKGSELEKQLTEMVKRLEEAEQREADSNRRAKFAEQAIRPGVGCSNVKAAYALATSEKLFNSEGDPDWKALRQLAPELFRQKPEMDAGATGRAAGDDINAALRKAAGY